MPNHPLESALQPHALAASMDRATAAWHSSVEPAADSAALSLHRANFELWHLEDSARDPRATAQQIADTKRAIDRTNQRRNDCVESLDRNLLETLLRHALPRHDAPLHSETPGQMLDRLSILSLKRYHTAEEANRGEAGAEHRERNSRRLAVLEDQAADLAACLDVLWDEVVSGRRRFKLYQQMKMYNDPDLNPVLYRNRSAGAASPQPIPRTLDPD